jgi:hypothetical protein
MSQENVEIVRVLTPAPEVDIAELLRSDELVETWREFAEPVIREDFEVRRDGDRYPKALRGDRRTASSLAHLGGAVGELPDRDRRLDRPTFWRPQRRAVPEWGETGDWIDLGRLQYQVQVEYSGRTCPQNAFSATDPDLALNSSSPIYADDAPGFTDLGPDRPASRANTFTFTLNLTRCLASRGFSFNPGEVHGFSFLAVNPSGVDNAQQFMPFKRE